MMKSYQDCTSKQHKIKRRRNKKDLRRCYYCSSIGHLIARCPTKEEDEAAKLFQHSLKIEAYNQYDPDYFQDDLLVAGSDKGLWENMWYISYNSNHHTSGNISMFKHIKSSYGIETYLRNIGRKLVRGIGEASVETNLGKLSIPNVYYIPSIDRNTLSYEQLIHQGYVIIKEGYLAHIYQTSNENSKEIIRKKGLSGKIHNWENQDYVDSCNKDYENFLRLEKGKWVKEESDSMIDKYMKSVSQEREKFNWNKAIILALEFNKFEDCISLISFLDDTEYIHTHKDLLRKKFEEMIHWFLNIHLSLNRLVPPYNNQDKKIELLDLYLMVNAQGGQKKVEEKSLWLIIAKDLGFEWFEGHIIKLIYARYLDVFEFEYRLYKHELDSQKEEDIEREDDVSMEQSGIYSQDHKEEERDSKSEINKRLQEAHEYALFMGNDWIGAKRMFKKRNEENKKRKINFVFKKRNEENKKRKINFDAAKVALEEAFQSLPKTTTSLEPYYV